MNNYRDIQGSHKHTASTNHDPGEEASPPAASNKDEDMEKPPPQDPSRGEGNRNPPEKLGKPPPLKPSMVGGRVAGDAGPPPRPRERGGGGKPTARPRERSNPPPRSKGTAIAADPPPQPRVWPGAAAAASEPDGVPPFFLLPAAAVDIPELQTLAKIRRGKLEIGGVGDWGREQRLYGEGTWIWRANLPRALSPHGIRLRRRFGTTNCTAAATRVDWGWENETSPSSGETTHGSSLGTRGVFFAKLTINRRDVPTRYTCP